MEMRLYSTYSIQHIFTLNSFFLILDKIWKNNIDKKIDLKVL